MNLFLTNHYYLTCIVIVQLLRTNDRRQHFYEIGVADFTLPDKADNHECITTWDEELSSAYSSFLMMRASSSGDNISLYLKREREKEREMAIAVITRFTAVYNNENKRSSESRP